MKFKVCFLILLIFFSFSAYNHEVKIADKNIEEIVKSRMNNMSKINSLAKKMYKNLSDSDFKSLNDNAIKLKHNANEFKKLFPKESYGGKAKKKLWEEKELFNEYIDAFLKDINMIISNIEEQEHALLKDNFNQMTSNCGTCHKKFKSK